MADLNVLQHLCVLTQFRANLRQSFLARGSRSPCSGLAARWQAISEPRPPSFGLLRPKQHKIKINITCYSTGKVWDEDRLGDGVICQAPDCQNVGILSVQCKDGAKVLRQGC